ncbi:thioredoxin TrxC [Parendozoicomonas haliclonae]|uniref:Thioredoxin n=1 Tax=Parendozoicomonas haliclonae TaxID=1960125 RepID=A0A1X7AHZ6_9GAMM|nr:thioredoxin TrxC [Parendozoicomonas haliclonae]SMA42015.1 Thioredoxin-2 [Parendozoicomonas haliclonae]
MQLVCPSCQALNRVPDEKLSDNPLCGKCHKPLLPGEPIPVSDASFARFVEKSELPIVIDFWASWCGPCQNFAPVFHDVAKTFASRALFIKVDTENNPQTAGRFAIRSIPTLMVMHKGKEVERLSGALPAQQFSQWLDNNLPAV